MYSPPAFRETRPEVLAQLVRTHPLGLLITAGPGGLMANPVPFLIDDGDPPVLRAHLSRANPQLAELAGGVPCLVVFQGPQAYVSPAWYATKQETGKVVPTWNYIIAQARGTAHVVEDAEWLRAQIGDLTQASEAGRADAWAVEDAPDAFIAAQIRGIAGVEIVVDQFAGKWKLSQNRNTADRDGVIGGLSAQGDDAMAAAMIASSQP